MRLTKRTCSVCGGNLLEKGKTLKCEYCDTEFSFETSDSDIKRIMNYLDESKEEALSNSRQNLYKVTHEEYLSKERIKTYVSEVKKLYPDDFMASFYDALVSENYNVLNNFLNDFDDTKYHDYLDEVIKGSIKSLEYSNVIALKNLVDKYCDISDKIKYNTEIERIAESINEGIYSLDIDRDFFICYSSKDMNKVLEIVDFLESNGLTCFVALRNLRHGIGSVENYKESIFKAMRNSKGFIFISSNNSRDMGCDSLRYEIPYLKNNLKDMPRIEYVIENYSFKTSVFAKSLIKQTFNGLEWCLTLEDLAERASNIVFSGEEVIEEVKAASKAQEFKFCISCGAQVDMGARFCNNCGSNEFASNIQELIKKQNEKREKELKEKEEQLKREHEAELKRRQEEEERIRLENEKKRLEEERKRLELEKENASLLNKATVSRENITYSLLIEGPGSSKVNAIKILTNDLGIGLMDAKKLVDQAPVKVIKNSKDKAFVDKVYNDLKSIGAIVRIIEE